MPDRVEGLPSFMSTQVADSQRFYVPANMQGGEVQVVSGGWERCARDYELRRPGFMHPTLELVVAGRGSLRIGDRTTPLERGVMFSYGPGVAHEIATDPADCLVKYFVNLAGARAEALMRDAGLAPGRVLTVAAVDELQAAFDPLVRAGQRGTANAVQVAGLQAQILMLLVSEVQLPSGQHASRARQTFLKCRAYLENNYRGVRTVEEAAEACGVTQAYFSRIFSRFAGQPAYHFLMRLKMGHAAALLEHHGLNVNETADALEMDPFHFSRAFKRVHGRAPSTFMPGR